MPTQIHTLMSRLESNNMQAFFVENKQEAVAQVAQILHQGDTVTVGGSTSLFEAGVIDHLRSGRYCFLDRYQEGLSDEDIRAIYLKSMDADAYFCSCNAVTLAGELYNVDGNANRISAIAYGPKSVIMIVGINKIVENLDEAVKRVKTIAAPAICKRRGNQTFCREKGYCIAIHRGENGMTAGCYSPQRTCCSFLVTGYQRIKNRIKVILVNESLGL